MNKAKLERLVFEIDFLWNMVLPCCCLLSYPLFSTLHRTVSTSLTDFFEILNYLRRVLASWSELYLVRCGIIRCCAAAGIPKKINPVRHSVEHNVGPFSFPDALLDFPELACIPAAHADKVTFISASTDTSQGAGSFGYQLTNKIPFWFEFGRSTIFTSHAWDKRCSQN